MKFLIDQPVSPLLAKWLREQGHDAFHVRERDMSMASDEAIIAIALAESRILITADLDFARIVSLSRRSGPAVILFRAGNLTDRGMLELLKAVLHQVESAQLEKSIAVVTDYSVRIAELPIR